MALQAGIAQAQPVPPPLPSPPLRIDALYHRADALSVPIRPTSGRWSVVGVHSDPGSDWDFTVTGSSDSAGSDQYGDRTDFVAIDGSVPGASDPKVKTSLWDGNAGYDLAFNDQTGDLPLPVHWVEQDFQVGGDSWPLYSLFSRTSGGQWTAGVRDVALVAGHDYLLSSATGSSGNAFLMQSDGTQLQGRNEAVATIPAGKTCTWFRPRTTGTYGLVVTFDNGAGTYKGDQWVDVVEATPGWISTEIFCKNETRVDGR